MASIELTLDQAACLPGGTLTGQARVQGAQATKLDLELVWHTTGKGDTDRCVALSRPLTAPDGFFSLPLPLLPWTYQGRNIKINWTAVVKIRTSDGKEGTAEAPFVLHPHPEAHA